MQQIPSDKTIIAMWSGPRNLSTALMRSFENRADTHVWDEPFYAAYLKDTGLDHPMADEVMAAGDISWKSVVQKCQKTADSAQIFYQKHMTHHMLPGYDRSWINGVTNAFLIRDPARVIASYGKKHDDISLNDIGFTQQVQLFNQICNATGKAPPVIDAHDVRRAPNNAIAALCAALNIRFSRSMLTWPIGPRNSDGAWAPHWYDAVAKSTSFAAPETNEITLTDIQKNVLEAASPIYQHMKQHALQIDNDPR